MPKSHIGCWKKPKHSGWKWKICESITWWILNCIIMRESWFLHWNINRILKSGSWLVRSAFLRNTWNMKCCEKGQLCGTALRTKQGFCAKPKKKLLQMQSAISESLNLYLRQFYLNINFYDRYIYIFNSHVGTVFSNILHKSPYLRFNLTESLRSLMRWCWRHPVNQLICWKLFKHSTMYNEFFWYPIIT